MPRRRLRTFTLWTGTLLCVLIAAAFVVSGGWVVTFRVPTPYGPNVYLENGAICVVLTDARYDNLVIPLFSWGWPAWNDWRAGTSAVGGKWLHTFVDLPLYAVFAAVAIPTLLIWRFWPKPPKPGHCRCGYDLQGNESGVCPECGERLWKTRA